MKKLKSLFKIFVVLVLVGCVACGYYLLYTMQNDLDDLSRAQRLSEQEAQKSRKITAALEEKQRALEEEVSGLKVSLQDTGEAIKAKNEILERMEKKQAENLEQLKAIVDISYKCDTALKEEQAERVKAVTVLEQKTQIINSALDQKITALAERVNGLTAAAEPASAPARRRR